MNNLKRAREDKNITQKEISKKIGISQQAYSLIENGKNKPSLSIAFKISECLEKDIKELFFAD